MESSMNIYVNVVLAAAEGKIAMYDAVEISRMLGFCRKLMKYAVKMP